MPVSGASTDMKMCLLTMTRPISTYGGRGVAQRGVLKWQHCIVHTDRAPPTELPREFPGHEEWAMQTPLLVRPTREGDRMEAASRLNLGKMYTVEHNVRVYNFGMIHDNHVETLVARWRYIMGLGLQQAQPPSNTG